MYSWIDIDMLNKHTVVKYFCRDVMTVAKYICSCACFYDSNMREYSHVEPDEPSTHKTLPQGLKTSNPFVSQYQTSGSPILTSSSTRTESVVMTNTSKAPEVYHHHHPTGPTHSKNNNLITDSPPCINPIHHRPSVSLPPESIVIIDVSSSSETNSDSSDSEYGSARITESELDDAEVSSNASDPWHVL